MGKTFDLGVFDVTPEQLVAMPKLRYNDGVAPKVGDYIVVYSNVMYGYWVGDVAVCSSYYETLRDATKYATWAGRNDMYYCIHKDCGVCSDYEVWHVVSSLDNSRDGLEKLLDSKRKDSRKRDDGLAFRTYECRCFAYESDVFSHHWDEPDYGDAYVGDLGLCDLDACTNFAKQVTAAGILPQVEIWAEFRWDGRGYDCWEHVRVCTYRNGVVVDRGC